MITQRYDCLVLSFLLFKYILSLQLIFPLKETKYKVYETNVCLGTPKVCEDYLISFVENSFLLTGLSRYQSNLSESASFIAGEKQNSCYDSLFLRDVLINKVYIYKTFETNAGRRGIFGFGPGNDDDNSNIAKLYKEAQGKKVFFLDLSKKILSIGDYPDEYKIVKETGKYKYCKLIKNYSYQCNLDSIYFSSDIGIRYNHFQIDSLVTICPQPNAIYASSAFMDLIIKEYFKEQIKEGICLRVYSEGYLFVECKRSYDYLNDKRLKNITIILNKFSLVLTPKELFTYHEGDIYFLIIHNPEKKGWHFGYPFLTKFLTVIDEEEMQIGFINTEHN